jgi:hypothetical protein
MWRYVAVAAAAALLSGAGAQGARLAAPSNTSPPTISGTAKEGETLTASSGTWSGSTPISFAYRWQRCNSGGGNCSNTSTGQTYKLQHGDVGHTMRVSVTASNSDGSASAVSGATGVVAKGDDPANTALPTINGTLKDGQTLTTTNGSWTGNPTSFSYQWRRCDTGGSNCRDVGGNQPSYALGRDDIGSTIRVKVRARNAFGSTDVTSAPTGVVAPAGPLPANTSPPTISGTAKEGQTLVGGVGRWVNNPTRFALTWMRCDVNGNGCGGIATGSSVRLGSADVGHRIRLVVDASNQYGTAKGVSAPTAVVASALPSGAIRLPSGEISLPVQMVAPPQRLVVSGVVFVPNRLHSRNAFVGRFRVTDTRGYVIRDALVYAIGLPYGWIRPAGEVVTGTDGWAQITLVPTPLMPVRRAALVLFLRARKPGDSLLSGVSTRRLVQVRIG